MLRVVSIGALTLLTAAGACAQNFPNRPVRIITAPPGGGADLASRLVGAAISAPLGQQVVIDNRPGGVVGAEIVSKSPPDGYTLLLTGSLWITPVFQDDVPWDPFKDFICVSQPARTPNVLVIHPSVPAKTVKQLVALAKARPGQLNYGSGVTGAATSTTGDLFRIMAGINITPVPYKGAGPAMSDLIAGQLQLMFAPVGTVAQYVKTGRLRALGVTTADPSALAPGLPSIAEAGVPGYEAAIMYGIFAPAKTPAPVVNRLTQEVVQSLKKDDVKEKFFNAGMEIVGSGPETCTSWMKNEMARLSKIVKESAVRQTR